MEKNNLKILIGFALLFFSIGVLSAFGISSQYWSENPLRMSPGESETVSLGLQNMVGNDDVKLTASLSSEGNIASLVDSTTEYTLKLGEGVSVPVKIRIPSNAQKGTTYMVTLSLKSVPIGEGKMLQVSSGVSSSFPVEIVDEKDTTKSVDAARNASNTGNNSGILFGILAVFAVMAILICFSIFKRKKSGKKR